MKRYFDSIDTLDRFTLTLDYHQDELSCRGCKKKDQLVSHGFIFRQRSQSLREAIGKRILCSNRYGRTGCGRTVSLYVAKVIPSLHYDATHLVVFLSALLANLSVSAAYQKATGQLESRQAWRWLHKLMHKLIDYRLLLQTRNESVCPPFTSTSRRLRLLLPTIARLFAKLSDCPGAHYQLLTQSRFM